MAEHRSRCFTTGLFALACWLLCSFSLSAGNEVESRVKAACLFNIAKFTDWPDAKFASGDAPILICCFCDQEFAAILERTVAGKTAGARRVAVRRIAGADDVRACHILFVGASQVNSLARFLLVRRRTAFCPSVKQVVFSPAVE